MVAPVSDEFWRALRARHPGLREALVADARLTAGYRGERDEFRSRPTRRPRCSGSRWVSDAFPAQALYRSRPRCRRAACRCCRGSRTGSR